MSTQLQSFYEIHTMTWAGIKLSMSDTSFQECVKETRHKRCTLCIISLYNWNIANTIWLTWFVPFQAKSYEYIIIKFLWNPPHNLGGDKILHIWHILSRKKNLQKILLFFIKQYRSVKQYLKRALTSFYQFIQINNSFYMFLVLLPKSVHGFTIAIVIIL